MKKNIMEILESMSELFFELANATRLEIIHSLQKQKMRLSALAREIDVTVQETSRQLNRLAKMGIVNKSADGEYQLSLFGQHIMIILPVLLTLIVHREYFDTHSFLQIPQEFILGISTLISSKFTTHVMDAFRHVERVIKDAKERIWILSDKALSSTLPLIDRAIDSGIDFKVVLSKLMFNARDFVEDENETSEVRPDPNIMRFIDDVRLVIVMNEKQAVISFPRSDGTFDYSGFSFTDEQGLNWCKRIFLYYWQLASEYQA